MLEINAFQVSFLAVQCQGEFFCVFRHDDIDWNKIVGWRKFIMPVGTTDHGKIFEMHIGVACQKAKYRQFIKTDHIQARDIGALP